MQSWCYCLPQYLGAWNPRPLHSRTQGRKIQNKNITSRFSNWKINKCHGKMTFRQLLEINKLAPLHIVTDHQVGYWPKNRTNNHTGKKSHMWLGLFVLASLKCAMAAVIRAADRKARFTAGKHHFWKSQKRTTCWDRSSRVRCVKSARDMEQKNTGNSDHRMTTMLWPAGMRYWEAVKRPSQFH